MKKNLENNYYLGLDLGTESVGWAATDLNYKLLRANNKNLWGVRLFEPAKTSADRRNFRESRRRLERRKLRINLLQEIFAQSINKIDPNFFARLEDSNLYDGDKRENTKFSLFSDKEFNDVDFHRKYKTVYHLRLAMAREENPDPRLVYLALHHIIKYRGHFLIDGDVNAIESIDELFENINTYLCERDLPTLKPAKEGDFRTLLAQKEKKTKRAEKYKNFFGVDKGSVSSYILDLIAGQSVSVKKLPIECENEKLTICFEKDWESAEPELRTLLQDDFWLIENAKLIYDYAQYKTLLEGCDSLSQAMVNKYEKHQRDLKDLKQVMRKYFSKEEYDLMFRDMPYKKTNYTAYSGKFKFGSRNDRNNNIFTVASENRSEAEFYKYVKEVLCSSEAAKDDEKVKSILADIEKGDFMPKQVSKKNSLLPYQLNLLDLRAILDNAEKYDRYAFLKEVDKNGISIRTKIESLLIFRMPYYVGPVNNNSEKYWIARKDDGRILPWNYQQKIDLVETEQRFIRNMTNNCQYVSNAKVLPKCSLLYEEYMFLDRVNKIRINGEFLNSDLKKQLSYDFAISGKKLSQKTLRQWLSSHNQIENDEEITVEGIFDDMKSERRMYYQFVQILGNAENVENHRKAVEDIILYSTIAGPEKSNLVKKLKEFDFLSDEQIKRIKGLSCNGWGRFSREFLEMRVGTNPYTGEMDAYSIIDALRDTNENLMEIYSGYEDKYGFRRAFEKLNQSNCDETNYDAVDELYCSPAVKKQIWQAVCVVKEISKVMGGAPKKIFVEVAREDGNKGERKDSRYKTLLGVYEKLKAENNAVYKQDVYDNLVSFEKQPQALNNQKLFLYFMQNGVDIYTGDPIDYNHLELYDKDHIYPRSKIKDDSLLNNLVLTLRTQNGEKTDEYPIDKNIQDRMIGLWKTLNKNYGAEKDKNSFKLMTDEKFKRLTRKTALTDEERADFINRQLVETRQNTKETITFLHRMFPDAEIVWSKAGNVSEFRSIKKHIDGKDIDRFVKSREINDIHHAKDAYLNIVVGNTYNVCYGHSAHHWLKENAGKLLPSEQRIYDHDVKTKDCIAWVAGENGTIAQVEKVMRNNAVLFTNESRVSKGKLFDATICKKADGLVPLKGATSSNRKFELMSNTQKYGGYDSESRVYYMLVKFTERKERKNGFKETTKYKLLGVSARFANKLTTNDSRIEYCKENGLYNPVILIPKIKIKTMFVFDGTMLMLSGKTGNQIIWQLAQQYNADEDTVRYFKKVCKVVEEQVKLNKVSKGQEYQVDEKYDGVNAENNKALYDTFVSALKSERYKGAGSLASLANKIDNEEVRQKFGQLPLVKQCKVLAEIQKALQCNAVASDLSLLGEGSRCGKILTSSVFNTLSGIKICHRSITGVFEQKIPLEEFDTENKA